MVGDDLAHETFTKQVIWGEIDALRDAQDARDVATIAEAQARTAREEAVSEVAGRWASAQSALHKASIHGSVPSEEILRAIHSLEDRYEGVNSPRDREAITQSFNSIKPGEIAVFSYMSVDEDSYSFGTVESEPRITFVNLWNSAASFEIKNGSNNEVFTLTKPLIRLPASVWVGLDNIQATINKPEHVNGGLIKMRRAIREMQNHGYTLDTTFIDSELKKLVASWHPSVGNAFQSSLHR